MPGGAPTVASSKTHEGQPPLNENDESSVSDDEEHSDAPPDHGPKDLIDDGIDEDAAQDAFDLNERNAVNGDNNMTESETALNEEDEFSGENMSIPLGKWTN